MANASCRIGSDGDVISRRIPGHVQRGLGHSVDTQHTILPSGPRKSSIECSVAEFAFKIVKEDKPVARKCKRRDPFPQFVLVGSVSCNREPLTSRDAGDAVKQQTLSRRPDIGIHEKEWGWTDEGKASQRCQKGCQPCGFMHVSFERKIDDDVQ